MSITSELLGLGMFVVGFGAAVLGSWVRFNRKVARKEKMFFKPAKT